MDLIKQKCKPCEDKSIAPFDEVEARLYIREAEGFVLSEDFKKISKDFVFKNFVEAIDFVENVADIAEEEGHHPDIAIYYNKVNIELWTHSIDGLSVNDFILAAKINERFEGLSKFKAQ